MFEQQHVEPWTLLARFLLLKKRANISSTKSQIPLILSRYIVLFTWQFISTKMYKFREQFFSCIANFFTHTNFRDSYFAWPAENSPLHSMASANLKKSEDFVTNNTAASKYIPRRPRISINWNPLFQTSLHKISKFSFFKIY